MFNQFRWPNQQVNCRQRITEEATDPSNNIWLKHCQRQGPKGLPFPPWLSTFRGWSPFCLDQVSLPSRPSAITHQSLLVHLACWTGTLRHVCWSSDLSGSPAVLSEKFLFITRNSIRYEIRREVPVVRTHTACYLRRMVSEDTTSDRHGHPLL